MTKCKWMNYPYDDTLMKVNMPNILKKVICDNPCDNINKSNIKKSKPLWQLQPKDFLNYCKIKLVSDTTLFIIIP